jgi:ferredoxin
MLCIAGRTMRPETGLHSSRRSEGAAPRDEVKRISALADGACTAIIAATKTRATASRRENATMAGKLNVHVDQDKCQGHARCKSLAPELFNLDEFGNAHEIGDGSVPAGLEDKAWLAQTNCPEIAIEVTEE